MRTGPFWDGVEGRAPVPPAARTLGFAFVAADEDAGTIEVDFTAGAEFTNPAGNVLGAFLAAMLYDTVGPALLATLGPGRVPVHAADERRLPAPDPARPRAGSRPGRHRNGDHAVVEAELSTPTACGWPPPRPSRASSGWPRRGMPSRRFDPERPTSESGPMVRALAVLTVARSSRW